VKEGYNGLYFKEGNQESLEQKIGFLLNHPQLVKEMGRNSNDIIENKINVHAVVERYINAFETVDTKSSMDYENIAVNGK
jgi:glycosyltransferase involved in cell wall biosynthesis